MNGRNINGQTKIKKQKNNKYSTLRIFENLFCSSIFGTFAFASLLFFNESAKAKEPNLSAPEKISANNSSTIYWHNFLVGLSKIRFHRN